MEEKIRTKILMTQTEIAETVGCSQTAIHYILKNDRNPSARMAEKLEKATGVCREAWIWPERHWNPYITFFGIKGCMHCPYRITRIKKAFEMAKYHFEQSPQKEQAFLGMARIFHTYLGGSDMCVSWEKRAGKKSKLLGRLGENTHPFKKKGKPKSFLQIGQGELLFSVMAYRCARKWSPQCIEETRKHVDVISRQWEIYKADHPSFNKSLMAS